MIENHKYRLLSSELSGDSAPKVLSPTELKEELIRNGFIFKENKRMKTIPVLSPEFTNTIASSFGMTNQRAITRFTNQLLAIRSFLDKQMIPDSYPPTTEGFNQRREEKEKYRNGPNKEVYKDVYANVNQLRIENLSAPLEVTEFVLKLAGDFSKDAQLVTWSRSVHTRLRNLTGRIGDKDGTGMQYNDLSLDQKEALVQETVDFTASFFQDLTSFAGGVQIQEETIFVS
ncbi:MAG TPA: hypothetical protein VLG12_03575 [Candidatus Saccharimonadales bacterium]|nr:hypothetical protein [Candidatus Saccharimonadales bacterium]